MKRNSINAKLKHTILILMVPTLIVALMIGIIPMFLIKSVTTKSLTEQLESNVKNLCFNKADLASTKLYEYLDYICDFAQCAGELYSGEEEVIVDHVLPPQAANAGKFAMQLYYASDDINPDSVQAEADLLGNMEFVWWPFISDKYDVITTIYLATESGFLISYDTGSDLAINPDGSVDPYDYFDSPWYKSARLYDCAFFTDTYVDKYGRGLTVTCASPIYGPGHEFKGTVCMDILISDLNDSVININAGEGSYGFIVNSVGEIIASPFLDETSSEFTHISEVSSGVSEISSHILSGTLGMEQLSNGDYCAYTYISCTNWKLCIYIPGTVISDSVDTIDIYITTSLLLYALAMVVVCVIVLFIVPKMSRSLTGPIVMLQKDVAQISGGNLDHRAEILSQDEVGELAESVNNMALSLDKYIKDLTQVTAEKERIGAELDVATHIQKSMLPCIFPAFPDRKEFDVYATMTPAKEVGGDFYDFFMVDKSHVAIVMADVSGKGIPAALFMVIGKTLIKDHTTPGKNLGQVFAEVNNLLCKSNSEMLFITAFEGVLDLATGEFRYVNAGHEWPFISRNGEAYKPFEIESGFVLAALENVEYEECSIYLNPGDRLFQYTDGVPESTDASGELYGMERLEQLLTEHKKDDIHSLLAKVKQGLDDFVKEAPQFDDITMLCFEYKEKMVGIMSEKSFNATVENIEAVTEYVNSSLESVGCSFEAQSQIDIAIDELFGNIAKYAYPRAFGNATVNFEFKPAQSEVVITFKDHGICYNPLEKADPDVTLAAEDREIGGLGIFLVKQLMDNVTYEYKDGQNILAITKKIR